MRIRDSYPHLLAALLAVSACGRVTLNDTDGGPGSDAGSGTDGAVSLRCTGDVALEDAWQCTIDTVCGLVDECFGQAFTFEDCTRLDLQIFDLSARYGEILMLSAVSAGTVAYDGQEMGRCLDGLGALTCSALFSSQDPFDVCAPFVGQIAVGGACVMDNECALPGSSCSRPNCPGDDLCCMGACSDVAPIDGTCGSNGLGCEPGAYCVNGTCATGETGARCTGDYECDRGNFCNGQLCAADYPAGAACTSDAQCLEPNTCVGQNIPGINPSCQRSIMTGDTCDGTCNSFASHYCERQDLQSLGTCQVRVTEGQACTPELMPCELGLRCDANSLTCVSYGGPGAACQGSVDCAFFKGTFCSTEIDNSAAGVCMERVIDGSTCGNNSHCQSGLCSQSVCVAAEACY